MPDTVFIDEGDALHGPPPDQSADLNLEKIRLLDKWSRLVFDGQYNAAREVWYDLRPLCTQKEARRLQNAKAERMVGAYDAFHSTVERIRRKGGLTTTDTPADKPSTPQ